MSIRVPHNVVAGDVIQTVSASAPAGPVTGALWLDTTFTPNRLKVWNGTAWVTAGGSGTDTHTVGGTAPSAPVAGDVWLDTATVATDLATQAELNAAVTSLQAQDALYRRPVLRLDYTPGGDLMNGAVIAAGAWTDLCAAQSFSMAAAAGAWLEVEVRMGVLVGSAGTTQVAARLLFDSGQVYPFASGVAYAVASDALCGHHLSLPNPLAAGSRTVKVQLISSGASINVYCRNTSGATFEWFNLRVTEWTP